MNVLYKDGRGEPDFCGEIPDKNSGNNVCAFWICYDSDLKEVNDRLWDDSGEVLVCSSGPVSASVTSKMIL